MLDRPSKIVLGPIDDAQTFKRSGVFWEYSYALSPHPSPEWIAEFSRVWETAPVTPKRHARIEEGYLVTICLAEDVAGDLPRFFQLAVEKTNAVFCSPERAS